MDAHSIHDLFYEHLRISVREQQQQIPATMEKLKDQWGQIVPPRGKRSIKNAAFST